VANSQTILVLVTNIATGCSITKPLQLLVEESAIANPIIVTSTPLFTCDDDGVNDGFHEFDLTLVESEVLGTQNPNLYKVTYHLSEADADSDVAPQGINPIVNPTTFINTVMNGQTIWVRITNMSTVSKCHDITNFNIEVEQLPEPKIQGGTICIDKLTDNPISTYVIDTGLDITHTFEWKKDGVIIAGETAPTLLVDKPGIYTVIAKSTNKCESVPVSVEVIQSGPASKVGVGYYVSNAFSDNQTITVDVNGYGVYQYKLDEGPWQDSPVFTNVLPGEHTITVRDTKTDNPCEDLVIIGANIIDYPNFFTPNGDGFRDTWNIIGLNQPDAKIYIFDRYGKLLKQISAVGDGWDGTYNGENLPATDYWFTVTYKEIIKETSTTKEFKAHFSLLR
jgi:gliding motility-associated-like protein